MSNVSVRRLLVRGAAITAMAVAGLGISLAPAHADTTAAVNGFGVNGFNSGTADVNGFGVNGFDSGVNGFVNGFGVNGFDSGVNGF